MNTTLGRHLVTAALSYWDSNGTWAVTTDCSSPTDDDDDVLSAPHAVSDELVYAVGDYIYVVYTDVRTGYCVGKNGGAIGVLPLCHLSSIQHKELPESVYDIIRAPVTLSSDVILSGSYLKLGGVVRRKFDSRYIVLRAGHVSYYLTKTGIHITRTS